MKKIEWNSKYKTISVYVIITAFIITCIVLLMLNLPLAGALIQEFAGITAPFIIGFAAAYLLMRPCAFLEHKVFGFIYKNKRRHALARGLSIFLLFLTGFGIVFLLTYFIAPELTSSMGKLGGAMPYYITSFNTWLNKWLSGFSFDTASLREDIKGFTGSFLDVAQLIRKIIDMLPQFLSSLGTGILNFFVGMIVCAYALFSREKFARQTKKLLYALFNADFARRFIEVMNYSNNVFLGYIMGTLASTLFIGVSTFIFLNVCGMPYPLLISVIIAVTNFIPFFGPFLGAIPSLLLLFTINQWYALWFIIFILVLQQIDGNIVLPKLVSMNVGLSAFWVLFSLILGGGLFGFWGLVLGVPVFAVIYSLISAAVNTALVKKEIPPENYDKPEDFQ